MSCNSVPDIAAIQIVYEREAATGSTRHNNGLQVPQAKCHDDGTDKFLCEVTLMIALSIGPAAPRENPLGENPLYRLSKDDFGAPYCGIIAARVGEIRRLEDVIGR